MNELRSAPRRMCGPVIIVDDDDSVRRALRRLLTAEGLETRAFASAEEALEDREIGGAGCLVVDIMLPGMDGIALVERLAELGFTPPVILITALDDERVRRRALESGARGFLDKPVDPRTLVALVRSVGRP